MAGGGCKPASGLRVRAGSAPYCLAAPLRPSNADWCAPGSNGGEGQDISWRCSMTLIEETTVPDGALPVENFDNTPLSLNFWKYRDCWLSIASQVSCPTTAHGSATISIAPSGCEHGMEKGSRKTRASTSPCWEMAVYRRQSHGPCRL